METILKNVNNISLSGKLEEQKKFCQLWPDVKAGLLLFQTIIKNPVVKVVINIIIVAGDAVQTKICN